MLAVADPPGEEIVSCVVEEVGYCNGVHVETASCGLSNGSKGTVSVSEKHCCFVIGQGYDNKVRFVVAIKITGCDQGWAVVRSWTCRRCDEGSIPLS